MKIYDISKEVFSSTVFPGDPEPQAVPLAPRSGRTAPAPSPR